VTLRVDVVLRERREEILRAWEALVRAEAPAAARKEPVLRSGLPHFLDALADWLASGEPSVRGGLRAGALLYVAQRLDERAELAQVLREYRSLREAIVRELLDDHAAPAGAPAGPPRDAFRVPLEELVRLNVALDEVLSDAVERFLAERDRAVRDDLRRRRREEEALRASEQNLRLLADAMPQIVCVLGLDGVPEYVNPSWTAVSGLDLEATRRVGWEGALHPDDIATVRECRRRVLKLLAPQDVEVRYRAADGSFHWFLGRLAPVVDDGRVVRLVGAGMDIEDRRRQEKALREQLVLKDQLSKVAESVPGVVCSFRLRPDGTVSMPFSAPAIAELYGISQADLGRDMAPVLARIAAEDGERVRGSIEESARTMVRWRAEFRYEHPTKGLRWIEGTSIPSREPDGSILWHGYVADVTDRKRAEEQVRAANERLRESDRRKDEFLGMLSHELRNPLAPIRHALYILDRADPAGPLARRAKEVATRQVAHLTRLVDDLLDVTRIARGKIELRRVDLDLSAVALRTAEDHRGQLEQRKLDLVVDVSPAPVIVNGDETRLAQVLGNLLNNAAKFTPEGGRVTLTVREEAGRAVVHVRDTGSGIDPAMLDAIFDPFTQAKQTLARSEGGLGLGLALVKGLVELHGGAVGVNSGGAGRGTDFVVTVPLAAPSRTAASDGRGTNEAPPPPRRRVLVVDDNVDAAETLAQLVQMQGHDAEVAHDGPHALALARAHPPDVVLCDIGLPGMDGYQVARALRAQGAQAYRLIAVSGYAQPEDVAAAAAAGFDRHVAKPLDPEKLASLLR
jgi:PAS domain S-box-containing protein